MIEQTIEPEDLVSPCLTCWNVNGDKNECLTACLRLQAYRSGKEYKELPEHPKSSQIAHKASEIANMEDDDDWLTQKTPLKEKPQQKKCAICGKLESKLRRGLCLKCYHSWQTDQIKHPVHGVFTKMTKKELDQARWDKLGECRIPGCKRIGAKRGLCSRHYRAWIGGRRLHPEIGVFSLKHKKTEKVTATSNEKAEEAIVDNGEFIINFGKYPKLLQAIEKITKHTYLPIEHVIINLLEGGISAVVARHIDITRDNRKQK